MSGGAVSASDREQNRQSVSELRFKDIGRLGAGYCRGCCNYGGRFRIMITWARRRSEHYGKNVCPCISSYSLCQLSNNLVC